MLSKGKYTAVIVTVQVKDESSVSLQSVCSGGAVMTRPPDPMDEPDVRRRVTGRGGLRALGS